MNRNEMFIYHSVNDAGRIKTMSKIKKIAAVMLSLVMIVCMFSVGASAAGSIYSNAKEIKSGKTTTAKLKSAGKTADYYIKTSKSGTLKITVSVNLSVFGFYVYDVNGNKLKASSKSVKSGSIENGTYYNCESGSSNAFKGTFSFSVDKGTYYIRIERFPLSGSYGSGDVSVKATFPSSSSSSSSSSGKVSAVYVPMKVGSTMQLSADKSGSGTVKWSSSNTSVATVNSSGKVTAKKKGTVTITAKIGSSKASVKIKVS